MISCFSLAIWHLNLRNSFTETCSVNTSAVHPKTTTAACALCAYGFDTSARCMRINIPSLKAKKYLKPQVEMLAQT